MSNLILDTDSYKSSHYQCYPPGTVDLFNYLESRGGKYDKTVFFGLQYLLKEYLSKPVTEEDVEEASEFFTAHGVPFNREGWMGIVKDHGGYIPMEIKAVPEGSIIPTGFPLLTCSATDPKYFWVVGWFETMILRNIWYPTTVATLSWHVKQNIKKYLKETADDLSGLSFKLHDFGSRGVSSRESAAVGGAAHLVNFQGSDTVVGVHLANKYYNAKMAAFSIPAAEHSTVTSWGREGEADAYANMLDKFAKPGAAVAIVSDSYDLFNAVGNIWGESLRQKVVDSGATVIIRPDSGEPVTIVNQVLHLLHQKFGSTVNSKGYRVLNNVRVIQGDGLNPYVIDRILYSAQLAGFSADNLAFGMGGGLLQQVDRDTQKFAYKCSSITIKTKGAYSNSDVFNGKILYEDRDVYKDPVTDSGKRSKKGRIGTAIRDGKFVVCQDEDTDNILRPVFRDGEFLLETTLAEVRERSEQV